MPFSSKAREIHDYIVSSGKADYWIGVARSLASVKVSINRGNLTRATFLLSKISSKPSFQAR